MPEKQPLQRLIPLKLVSEPEDILLISKFEKIEQLRACLHYTKRWRLGVVDQHGNATFSSDQLLTLWKYEVNEPLGSSRRNQSSFCLFVIMLLYGDNQQATPAPMSSLTNIMVVVHSVP